VYVGYELKENLFIDFSAMVRKYETNNLLLPNFNKTSTLLSLGIRMNMFRRMYDY
jgi:hypothetical protein